MQVICMKNIVEELNMETNSTNFALLCEVVECFNKTFSYILAQNIIIKFSSKSVYLPSPLMSLIEKKQTCSGLVLYLPTISIQYNSNKDYLTAISNIR